MKAHEIPCPHLPPSRGDNTVSVAQGSTATGQGIKRMIYIYIYIYIYNIYIYIYIYTPDQLNAKTTLDVNLHFLSTVCDLKKEKKKRVYFRRLMLLPVYSNHFLHNHTGKVVPHVFPSC